MTENIVADLFNFNDVKGVKKDKDDCSFVRLLPFLH